MPYEPDNQESFFVTIKDENLSLHDAWLKRVIVHQADRIVNELSKVGTEIMISLDALSAAVANETSVDQSVIALLNGVTAQLNDLIRNGTVNPTELQRLVDQINSNTSNLSAAITANTPQAPETPTDETPQTPPIDTTPTPVDNPPVDATPTPVDNPPVDTTPPVETTPTDTPPAPVDNPPVDTTPAEQPALDSPPIQVAPADVAPIESDPVSRVERVDQPNGGPQPDVVAPGMSPPPNPTPPADPQPV